MGQDGCEHTRKHVCTHVTRSMRVLATPGHVLVWKQACAFPVCPHECSYGQMYAWEPVHVLVFTGAVTTVWVSGSRVLPVPALMAG